MSARNFRSIVLTAHRPLTLRWNWVADETLAHARAVVLFPTAEPSEGSAQPFGYFVPPFSRAAIEWSPATDLVAIWVPLETLREFISDAPLPSVALQPTPMVLAFRAFALAIARNTDETSSVSRYAIEQLLAEMVFGALLEAHSLSLPEPGQVSLIDRARSRMLLRRGDPDFTTAELAAELHVSPRQLQRAYARTGTTPGDALRHMRVELAVSMLQNPDYAVLPVDEIAAHAGFTGALQLRRALRAEGMPAPTAIRLRSTIPTGQDS